MLKWCTTACIAIPRPLNNSSFTPTGRFSIGLERFFLVWRETAVSTSIYTSLQRRKNETHIIGVASGLGISQGSESILEEKPRVWTSLIDTAQRRPRHSDGVPYIPPERNQSLPSCSKRTTTPHARRDAFSYLKRVRCETTEQMK